MAKKNAFNTVTTYSKVLAFIMFVTFPFAGFYVGMHFQKALDKPFMQEVYESKPAAKPLIKPEEGGVCTMDAMQCPDGSYVGRKGSNCDFAKCLGEK